MSRKPVIVGNWKMYMAAPEAIALARSLKVKLAGLGKVELGVAPPFISIPAVREALKETEIGVGAQNMHFQKEGAFTGEISAGMLVAAGCRYVILGHSERRQLFGEKDDAVAKKAKVAHDFGLIPIVCIGETLEERETGRTENVVGSQVDGSFAGLTAEEVAKTIVAYEPVWAIGTGKTATPEMANAVHIFIRSRFNAIHGEEVAARIRIQYGGSVKPDNAKALLACSDIDGALVGGASLKADDFAAIAKSCS